MNDPTINPTVPTRPPRNIPRGIPALLAVLVLGMGNLASAFPQSRTARLHRAWARPKRRTRARKRRFRHRKSAGSKTHRSRHRAAARRKGQGWAASPAVRHRRTARNRKHSRRTSGKTKAHKRHTRKQPTLAQARLRLASVTSPLPRAWSPEFETIIKKHSGPHRLDPGKPPVRFHGAQIRRARCLALLRKHHVPFRMARPHFGIAAPVLLTGPVGGIRYRNKWKPKEPPLMDCLLALTLWRAAPVWRRHGVRTIIFSNTYRKGRRGDPRPSRHALGLAMDVRDIEFRDGQVLNVEKDWEKFYGRPGHCVGSVRSDKAARLRSLLCDLEAANIYRRILSPDSDHGHRDHFHMAAAKPGERWSRERWAGRLLYQPLPGTKLFASWYHWYRCYKHLTWRGRKACWRRRRPRWVQSGNPHRFTPAHLPTYLAKILGHRWHPRNKTNKALAHTSHAAARPSPPPAHPAAAVPATIQNVHRATGHRQKDPPATITSEPDPKRNSAVRK